MISRGRLYEVPDLPALLAMRNGERVGLLAYHVEGDAGEIAMMDSLQPGLGIGTALLDAGLKSLRRLGCRRAWLITTNDNLAAMHFYRARGWTLVAIHRDAVTRARALKPEISLLGNDGIIICDELEFERILS
jgi:ribosomal protein S18 acetylase RimI-like enzyme